MFPVIKLWEWGSSVKSDGGRSHPCECEATNRRLGKRGVGSDRGSELNGGSDGEGANGSEESEATERA